MQEVDDAFDELVAIDDAIAEAGALGQDFVDDLAGAVQELWDFIRETIDANPDVFGGG